MLAGGLQRKKRSGSPSLSLSLSLPAELLVFFLPLPSLLSDLTVGGSPSELPPVSVDFLLQTLVLGDQATRGLAATHIIQKKERKKENQWNLLSSKSGDAIETHDLLFLKISANVLIS